MYWLKIQRTAKIVLIITLFAFLEILATASITESKVPSKLAPDMIFHHGKIITVDNSFGVAEAVAIKGERFIAVGKNEDILELAGDKTRLIDLGGKTVIPGLIDAHVHATHISIEQNERKFVQFNKAQSIADMLQVIKKKVAETPSNDWILGTGPYHSFDFIKERRFPDRWELDTVTPNNPFFMHFRGHLGVLNSRALALAGITKDTPDPNGGRIVKDPRTGEPTGWLIDNAMYNFVMPLLPQSTRSDWLEAVKRVNKQLRAMGITSIINQSGDALAIINALQELRRKGELTTRWQVNYAGSSGYFHRKIKDIPKAVQSLGLATGFGDEWIRAGSIGEFHSDGLIEAPLTHEPYAEEHFGKGWRGLLRHTREEIKAVCSAAAENNFQVEIHASGDAALDLVLDIFEEVNQKNPIVGKRWIITHGGLFPTKRNIERIKSLGVIVSTQQTTHWYQLNYYRKYWKEEMVANLFPNKTWLDARVMVVGGSDAGISSLQGIYACVTRKNVLGETLGPDQAVSREDALKLYTINAAYASFEENIKGSIEEGKLADLVVLSDDLLTVPEGKIKDIQVLMTVVGGRIVFEKSN